MKSENSLSAIRAVLLAATALGGPVFLAGGAYAQVAGQGTAPAPTDAPAQSDAAAQADPATEGDAQDIVVTGYRQSLESAAREKRERTNFTDSIFAEDIGKFPDTNLAESLQRLPGIQIERDINNEGSRINVRGLGSGFTVLTLNNSQIQSQSETFGNTGEGRGISLDLFPAELFRSLTISKSAQANQLEGAIAGNVDLRPIRPFDREGFNFNWTLKGTYQDVNRKISPRLGAFVSNTWDTGIGKIGLLGGFAYVHNKYRSDQFHTVGHTTYNLQARCPTTTSGCNSLTFAGNASNPTYGYGGGATIPATTVPTGTGFGLVNGAPLTVCGPGGTSGLSCSDLSYTILPRLARSEFSTGERKRATGIVTAQWQPAENLTFNFDAMYSHSKMYYSQNDMMIMVRSTTNVIPIGFEINEDKLLTKGTFANLQALSENRRVYTNSDFGFYSGSFEWQPTDLLRIRGSASYNTSNMEQRAWTFLLRTAPGLGLAATYEAPEGAATPTITMNKDMNDPNLGWMWDTLRIQPAFRQARQRDFQLHGEYGDETLKLSAGIQLPKFERRIQAWDVSNCATSVVANGTCPNSTVISARNGAIAAVPNASLGSYLMPFPYRKLYQNSSFNVGLNAWALPNYDKLESAIDIDYFTFGLDPVNRVNTFNPRSIEENTHAAYMQLDSSLHEYGIPVKYNVGVRYVETDQDISGIVSDPTTGRGVQYFNHKYHEWLPSFNIAYDLTDKLVLRFAGSRTMTRPSPTDLAPSFSISTGGDSVSFGNPELQPYFSKGLDAGLEWYIAPNNTIAINLWQKKVKGFTEVVRRLEQFGTLGINFNNLEPATRAALTNAGNGDPNAAIVTVSQRQNTPEIITLRGVEVSWLQPLDFITKGLGFTANYTRIDLSTNRPGLIVGTRQRKPPVTSLSPDTFNLSAFYENHGISARVSYNYRDPYITGFGPSNNVEGDSIQEKSSFVDASISFDLPFYKAARVILEGQNLTNQAQIVNIDGNRQMPLSAVAPGRTFTIGISGSF